MITRRVCLCIYVCMYSYTSICIYVHVCICIYMFLSTHVIMELNGEGMHLSKGSQMMLLGRVWGTEDDRGTRKD